MSKETVNKESRDIMSTLSRVSMDIVQTDSMEFHCCCVFRNECTLYGGVGVAPL